MLACYLFLSKRSSHTDAHKYSHRRVYILVGAFIGNSYVVTTGVLIASFVTQLSISTSSSS